MPLIACCMPKVSDYLSFVLKLILAFGLVFEMPLFAFFLARMNSVYHLFSREIFYGYYKTLPLVLPAHVLL